MASAEVGTVSMGEVVSMSDSELAQFIQRHRLSNGDYHLPIDGWHKLSRDERARLAKRLEAQKRALAHSPTACSRPLDLDDLDARLRQAAAKKPSSLHPEPRVIQRPWPPTPPIDITRLEVEAYHQLLNNHGRPLYPVNIIHDVFQDPDSYAELLRPWKEGFLHTHTDGIFRRQLQRWQDFRRWQNDNRDREDDDDDFLAYVNKRKRCIKDDYTEEAGAEFLAKIEADPLCLKSQWELEQFFRMRQRRLCREHGCRGFYNYKEAVKRRLARHGFVQPFELAEDPNKQDKLATWIEYLNYEYWWLDTYASDIERLEPEHDRLWQQLVDKNVLKPHETKEFVRTAASGMETQTEKDEAWKAVQQTESEANRIYALTQKDPKRLEIPRATRISMMKNGTEKLLAAKRQLELAKKRSDLIIQFVRATFEYVEAKKNAARHRILVQWVLDQVPLVEFEMKLSNNAEPGFDGGKRAKRGRTTDDEDASEIQNQKKPRFDPPEPRLADASSLSKTTETQAEPRQSLAISLLQNGTQATVEGPRRSARIAVRREGSRIVGEPEIPRSRSLSRPDASSAQLQVSHSLNKATKAPTTRRRPPVSSQDGIAKPTQRSHRRRQRSRG